MKKKSTYQAMVDRVGIVATREYFRKKAEERREKKRDEVLKYRRKWHSKNSDRLAIKKREARACRTDEEKMKQSEYDKKRREADPDRFKEWRANWRANNQDKIAAYNKKNREKILKRARENARKNRPKATARHKQRCQEDPVYHTVAKARARLGVAVRRAFVRKSFKSLELLGCTEAQFSAHIESKFADGMTWDNRHLWHIDHIKPISKFDLSDPEQQKSAFHYLNTQPLWIEDNLVKHAKF